MTEKTYETTFTAVHSLLSPLYVSITYSIEEGEQVFECAVVNGHTVCEDAAIGLHHSLTQSPPLGVKVSTSLVRHETSICDDRDAAEEVYRQFVNRS